MKHGIAALILGYIVLSSFAHAQMSADQKVSDFRQLAAVYVKNYAPYEWKRDVFGFDLFDLRPWLGRVRSSKTDLEFWELCAEYVASLRDGHSTFLTPGTFLATLPFSVDLYDGKALVDSIDRWNLSSETYAFEIGDELVTLDGKTPEEWIQLLSKYSATGNPVATRRLAAGLITVRPQLLMPHAHKIGDTARVVIRRAATDELEIHEMEWIKEGAALDIAGLVPSPRGASPAEGAIPMAPDESSFPVSTPEGYDVELPVEIGEGQQGPIRALTNISVDGPRGKLFRRMVRGLGDPFPVFEMPENFVQRLGWSGGDVFFSGTYTTDDTLRIGFIRIPDYSPAQGAGAGLNQFAREITFFEQNTDGLVIDNTRNPGGNACYLQELVRLLNPQPFRTLGFEFRASDSAVQSFAAQVEFEKAIGSEEWVVSLWQSHLDAMRQANREVRGRTGPVPICSPSLDVEPFRRGDGQPFAYTKPIIVLADELSASGGDFFPAVLQDNLRAKLLGTRTMGLGGTVQTYKATHFSEGTTSSTGSLAVRKQSMATGEFPAVAYIENVGARPDIPYDAMTRENLMSGGRPFVDFFTKAIAGEIRASQP